MTVTAPDRPLDAAPPTDPTPPTDPAPLTGAGDRHLAEVERTARRSGLAAGLAVALQGVPVTAAPTAVVALPAALARSVPDTTVVPHGIAAAEGIVVLRRRAHSIGTGAPAPLAGLLAAARLGASRRLVAEALDHVTQREVGGEPIVRKQLVTGVLADLFTEIEALRRLLQVAPSGAVDAHDRIDALDWTAATLLGARGFVAGTSTWAGHVSRLVANCWIPREVATCPLPF